MKKLVASLVLMVSSVSFAAPTVCTQSPAVPDDNYTVSILRENGRNYLEVVHSTLAGPVKTKEIAKSESSNVIGAPVVYSTKSYTLNVNFTTARSPKGRLGTFTVKADRKKVSVYCK